MESGSVYGVSNMTVLFQNDRLACSSQVLESLWLSNSSPSFDGDSGSGSGSASMVKFEHGRVRSAADKLLLPPLDGEDNGSDDGDGYFHQPEKKRRLRADQVQFLEKHFEVENKLEPDRKVQLAKELGLQPRQVAIWFQNRRARSKSKQIEKDYDSLKASYDKLKADYEILLKEKDNLKNEVFLLTDKMHLREKEKANSEPADPIKPVIAEPQSSFLDTVSEDLSDAPMVVCKQEAATSAKSDVFDSDSPRCTDPNHCSLLEPADSSHVFEPDHSDFSQDEEDNLSRSLFPPPFFPKLGYACYDDQPENCCYLGSPVEEQPSWLWPY